MGAQLCAALQHSHDKGIIHRDLKPSNVMMLRDGTVKLTDFGIAKDTDVTALTAANSTVGTAAYMSPEQCRGSREITNKSDLYSLGVMLYELLTGRKPFTAETAMEMFLKHANAPFAPPSQWVVDCPPWLNTIICQLMEKKPEQRQLNADTVGQALRLGMENMAAQKSAGVEAAQKRRADRTGTDVALDETDKNAARLLLGKKKKKKKTIPFYRKGWFTVLALACLGTAMAVVAYFAFIRPPSAESLYEQANAVMKSDSDEDRKEARAGPIATLLSLYPEYEKATVRAWADRVDRDTLENQMLNRRNAKFAAAGDAEKEFRLALDNEELGKLDLAARLWGNLQKLKTEKDTEQHAWGLIGEKYLKDLQAADDEYGRLKTLLRSEEISKKAPAAESKYEEMALGAVRAETAKQWTKARDEWELLGKSTETEPEQRRWHLLAIKQLRELKNKD
jgi:eukaryotic-like serine/threonine-protein kinase